MTKSEIEAAARVALVDEYGDLQTELAPFKAKQARLEALAKTIRSWYVDQAGDQAHTAAGLRYQAVLGAKGSTTTLADMPVIAKALGRKRFMLAVSITLKALQEFATPSQVTALAWKIPYTGSRDLLVTPLAQSEAKEQAA